MKRIYLLASILFLGALFAGCASNSISKQAREAVGWKNAPKWVLNGYDGEYSAVGSAPIIDKNIQFARSEAMTSARGELSKRIESKIKATLTKEGERVDDKLNEKVKSIVSETTQHNIQGIKLKDTWIDDDGKNLYVLIHLDSSSTKRLKDHLSKQFEALPPSAFEDINAKP